MAPQLKSRHTIYEVGVTDVKAKCAVHSRKLVGSEAEPTDTPIGAPAPTSPQRPIKAEEHYLRRQLSQSHRAQRRITDDLSLLMAEGDKFWYGLKCCTTIIVTILTAILLLVILRWVLYK